VHPLPLGVAAAVVQERQVEMVQAMDFQQEVV
jgi:hypothetical protein